MSNRLDYQSRVHLTADGYRSDDLPGRVFIPVKIVGGTVHQVPPRNLESAYLFNASGPELAEFSLPRQDLVCEGKPIAKRVGELQTSHTWGVYFWFKPDIIEVLKQLADSSMDLPFGTFYLTTKYLGFSNEIGYPFKIPDGFMGPLHVGLTMVWQSCNCSCGYSCGCSCGCGCGCGCGCDLRNQMCGEPQSSDLPSAA
ncbi:MAG: hypothetical protein ACYCOU_06995 [Sulfobacillus sp.]